MGSSYTLKCAVWSTYPSDEFWQLLRRDSLKLHFNELVFFIIGGKEEE